MAVIVTVSIAVSSAGVIFRAATIFIPFKATRPLVSPVIATVPVNWDPSDIFTVRVERTMPAVVLSGRDIVGGLAVRLPAFNRANSLLYVR